MSPLLGQLRLEHVGLSALLHQAMRARPGTPEATAILEEARQVLLEHLAAELDGLVVPLREASAQDPDLRALLASNAAERALRQATFLFTRLDLSCSKTELANAHDGMMSRFLWEETVHFPACERIRSDRSRIGEDVVRSRVFAEQSSRTATARRR
jgi:hypothetical protein